MCSPPSANCNPSCEWQTCLSTEGSCPPNLELLNYLFWAVLLLLRVFSTCGEWGLFSCCDAWASHRGGFFSYGAHVLGILGMWNHPGPGIKPASPALAGRFLSTEPPGKSCSFPSDAEQYLQYDPQ